MDPPPPPMAATTSPPGLGVGVADNGTESPPLLLPPTQHPYQYNVSHRWPDFANFMNYQPPPSHPPPPSNHHHHHAPPPHPGFATFSGSPGGMMIGSAEAYHSYHQHYQQQLSAHHQVINGISMCSAGA